MDANALRPLIEQQVARLRAAPQSVAIWLEQVQALIRTQGLRNATDWEYALMADVDESTDEVDADGGVVYAVLVQSIRANPVLSIVVNTTTAFTYTNEVIDLATDNGFNANSDDTLGGAALILWNRARISATEESYSTVIIPGGMQCDLGITVGSDPTIQGTTNDTDDVIMHVLYRSTVEVPVE